MTIETVSLTVSMVGIKAVTVDRAGIFAEVLQRNAVRRQALLPPLDVRAEFERAVALAVEREVRTLAKLPEHQAVLARIQAQVIKELVRKVGPGPNVGQSWGGRYFIGHETSRRFWAYMRAVYGAKAKPVSPKHPIPYGNARVSQP